MPRGRPRFRGGVSAVVAVLLLASCGGSAGGGGGPSSSATFVVRGTKFETTQSGSIKETFGGNPELNYSGPGGCAGRYFTVNVRATSLTFHYSSQDAYLIYDRTVYHFVTGPQLAAGQLVWDHTFSGDRIIATVACPPPPPSGPLLPPNY
jgi:hypothetical protein